MLLRDCLLVRADKPALADDILAADEQPVDPMRGRKDEPRDRVPGPGQLEHVRPPNREVGAAAGLDCAEVSSAAWSDLLHGIHATVTVTDEEAHEAMRELAAHGHAIGDSGAAPLAALHKLDPDLLGDDVVLIATEGVTDPDGYAAVVGSSTGTDRA